MEIEEICYHYAYLGYMLKSLEEKKENSEIKEILNKEPLVDLKEKIALIIKEARRSFCQECKTQLRPEDIFCSKCGKNRKD